MSGVHPYLKATFPALLVLGFFVWFANWIPQTRWTPPVREAIAAEMTPLQLASVGEKIVRQRGCLTCHTIEPGTGVKGQGRGPNLASIAARRAQGVPGGPASMVEYFVESLYEPGAYLVEDYANIMPLSTRPPAKLSYEEVVAVINYLQTLGGTPSVKIGDVPKPPGEAETATAAPVATAAAAPAATAAAAPADPASLLGTFQCLACHSLKEGEVLLGPALSGRDLTDVATAQHMSPEAYVMDSIVNPQALEREGFPKQLMPGDYGTRLSAAQLHVLVSYLLVNGGEQ